jgi:Carbohydrate binding domain (family 11)
VLPLSTNRVRRYVIVLLGLAMVGCDRQPAAGLEPAPDASSTGAPDASSTGAPDADVQDVARRAAIMLDDFEGGGEIPTYWSLNRSPGAALSWTPPEPPRGASRQALHVLPGPTATGADIFMHHHVDWTQMFSGVRFWVRADEPVGGAAAVAVTSLVSETHGEALAAGRPWLMARLPAGPVWTQVTVLFDTLLPEGPGTPQETFGGADRVSELHFLAPDASPSGIWLDDIELLCGGAGCAWAP